MSIAGSGTPWSTLPVALDDEILKYLASSGFYTASPVQAVCVPQLLSHRDVLCHAPTGSGKTLAFLVPLAQLYIKLLSTPSSRPTNHAFCLIIVPARELAAQIAAVAEALLTAAAKALPKDSPAANAARRVLVLTGGSVTAADLQRLASTPYPILVGTPGRLVDVLEARPDSFKSIELLVLDEADRVLDVSFSEHVDRLLRALPRQRRTAVASATLMSKGAAGDRLKTCGLRNPIVVSLMPAKKGEADDEAAAGSYGVASVSVPSSIQNCAVVVDSPAAKVGWLVTALMGLSLRMQREADERGQGAPAADGTPRKRSRRAGGGGGGGVASKRDASGVDGETEVGAEPSTGSVHRVLVFCLTCRQVEWIHAALTSPAAAAILGDAADGMEVRALHGQMQMRNRRGAVGAFARDAEESESDSAVEEVGEGTGGSAGGTRRVRVLLCTDVAARGLDFPNVDDVIQLDPPTDPSTFVHRVGRTGRFGKSGRAHLLLLERETQYLDYWKVRQAPLTVHEANGGPLGAAQLGLPETWEVGAAVVGGRAIREGGAPLIPLDTSAVSQGVGGAARGKRGKGTKGGNVSAPASTLRISLHDCVEVGDAFVDAIRGVCIQRVVAGECTVAEAAKIVGGRAPSSIARITVTRVNPKTSGSIGGEKDTVKRSGVVHVLVGGSGKDAVARVIDGTETEASESAAKERGAPGATRRKSIGGGDRKAGKGGAAAAKRGGGGDSSTVESGVLLSVDAEAFAAAAAGVVSYVRAAQEHTLRFILRLSATDIPPLAEAAGLLFAPSLTDTFGSSAATKARALRGVALRRRLSTKRQREAFDSLVPRGEAVIAVEVAVAAASAVRKAKAKADKAAANATENKSTGPKGETSADRGGLSLRNAARAEIRTSDMSRRQKAAAWSSLEKEELAKEARAAMMLKQGRITEEEFEALVADPEADPEVAAETDAKKRAAARRAVEARHAAIREKMSQRLLGGKAAAPTLAAHEEVAVVKPVTPAEAAAAVAAEVAKIDSGIGRSGEQLRTKVAALAQRARAGRGWGRRVGGGRGIFTNDETSDDSD